MNKSLNRELAMILGATAAAIAGIQYARNKKNQRVPKALGLAALGLALLPSQKTSFRGRSAVITGGSRGLGFAMARELLLQGAHVTLLARDGDELDRAKATLSRLSTAAEHSVFTVICDVTKPEQLDLAFAEARARFGRIDLLINNAGSVTVGPFHSVDDEDIDAQLRLHLLSVIHAIRMVRPYLRQVGGGQIVNISSIGGKIPMPHMSAYCASKFALGGFSESIAAELKAENISITTAYPGLMRTGSPKQAVFKGDHEKEYAWFALSDVAPGLSVSAESAARRILSAAKARRAEVVISIPAKLGALAHALVPETFAATMSFVNGFLPTGQSHERKTGAASRGLLENQTWAKPFQARAHEAERELNQADKTNADFNLGVRPQIPT